LLDDFDDLDDDDEDESATPSPFNNPRRPLLGMPIMLPPLNDPRWHKGIYVVARPVQVYRQPHPLGGILAMLPPAERLPRPALLYILDVQPGWSAVYTQSITGFVRTNEISFKPYYWWQERRDDLIVGGLLLLALLALAVSALGHQQQVEGLLATVTAQQAQIEELEVTLTAEQP
jgi:hypothetical protein